MSTIISFLTRLFFVGAAAGFGLSALAHFLSFLPFSHPAYSAFYALHFGIFILVIPVMVIQFTDREIKELYWKRPKPDFKGEHRRKMMIAMTRYAPEWARKLATVLFIYAIINFIIGIVFLRQTDNSGLATPLRLFSGHWMVFYYYFALILYSKAREQALKQETPQTYMDTRYQPQLPDDHSQWPR